MNVKVGDKIRVIKNTCAHNIPIGDIVKVTEIREFKYNKGKTEIVVCNRWCISSTDYIRITSSINKNISIL